ncbi:MAG TPA: SigE family RNA polymerase sigma factor [Mycobacteriales bacterium]|nr:SigE family RNA polymerase sigma factor [Mycobacteriales bacterium]
MVRAEPDGFTSFVATSGGRLVRLAYGLTGDRGLAEDLVQEALAKVYLRWGRLADPAAAEAYTRRVVVTTHVSMWRRRRVAESLTDRMPEIAGQDAYAALDGRDALWSALATLGRKQRAVIVLRYFEDRDDAEIGSLLGCSTATVRSQAARALATLRALPGFSSGAAGATDPATPPTSWSKP